jgi:Skp family chaperone for outer membrane proteins
MGARAEAVAKMRSDWKALPFGNPERKTLDAEISKATAKIEADKAYLQADFFQREASMYSACYHDVRAEVDRYSKAHGIQLVLRSSELEPEDKRDDPVKLKEWLESLFIEHANLDITDEILAALRR